MVEAKFYRHRNADDRALAAELGTLTFDDGARQVVFKDDAHDGFEIPYDSMEKVLFETTAHMRRMTPAAFGAFAPGCLLAFWSQAQFQAIASRIIGCILNTVVRGRKYSCNCRRISPIASLNAPSAS
ncbi:MAG: hypothetical protein J2P13_05535 [Acidobacteria bacterium]|nr:hypothetical protein [Acidobacteriota bacterium]